MGMALEHHSRSATAARSRPCCHSLRCFNRPDAKRVNALTMSPLLQPLLEPLQAELRRSQCERQTRLAVTDAIPGGAFAFEPSRLAGHDLTPLLGACDPAHHLGATLYGRRDPDDEQRMQQFEQRGVQFKQRKLQHELSMEPQKGSDIHLVPGQDQHLPHEAWHLVQQAQGRVRPTLQLNGGVAVNDDPGLEREADQMGARAQSAGG